MSIKGFEIDGVVKKYDYESLDNLPFYEELATTIFDPQDALLFDEDEGQALYQTQSLGLQIGGEVSYKIYSENGDLITENTAPVYNGEEFGMNGHPLLYIQEDLGMDDYSIIILIDNAEMGDGEPIYSKDYCVCNTTSFGKYVLEIISSSVKKIDKKFLPDDLATKLEVATYDELGGVAPVEKTDEMTQEIGIDEEGRLFTKAVLGAESYNPSLHTAPCAIDGENKIWAKVPEITTTSSIQQGSTEIPTSDAVYSFIEELLAEGEY